MNHVADPVYTAQTDDGDYITVAIYCLTDRLGPSVADHLHDDMEIEVIVELEGEPDPVAWRMTRSQAVEIIAGLVHALAWRPS